MMYRAVCVAIALFSAAPAWGVVIVTGNGAGNSTAPANDPGWYNVGQTGSSSAVYLGSNWVITSSHVVIGPTTFRDPVLQQDVTYQVVPNSGVTLTNGGTPGESATTDLVMYRIANDPVLGAPRLHRPILGSQVPTPGDTVIGIGRGLDRATGLTNWNASWTEVPGSSTFSGYKELVSQTKRWGDNKVFDIGQVINVGTIANPIHLHSFRTRFDSAGQTPSEYQAAVGDSGGGAFHINPATGRWELAGVIGAVQTFANQPASTAVFGNWSVMADLAFYRNQILALNPIPGDVNGNGFVDLTDVQIVGAHWQQPGPTGDVNGDGIVNLLDVQIVGENWTGAIGSAGASGAGAGGGSGVPEPATAWLALGAATLLLGYAWAHARRARRLQPVPVPKVRA